GAAQLVEPGVGGEEVAGRLGVGPPELFVVERPRLDAGGPRGPLVPEGVLGLGEFAAALGDAGEGGPHLAGGGVVVGGPVGPAAAADQEGLLALAPAEPPLDVLERGAARAEPEQGDRGVREAAERPARGRGGSAFAARTVRGRGLLPGRELD